MSTCPLKQAALLGAAFLNEGRDEDARMGRVFNSMRNSICCDLDECAWFDGTWCAVLAAGIRRRVE